MATKLTAADLRVGNYIMKDGEVFKSTIYTPLIVEREESNFEPIPLTEEWLIKFGFDSINEYPSDCNRNFTKSDNPQYWVQFHTDCNDFIFYGINNSIELSFKYVHQLQNLYYALTNTELIIKEDK